MGNRIEKVHATEIKRRVRLTTLVVGAMTNVQAPAILNKENSEKR
jgi:hypothetical protein